MARAVCTCKQARRKIFHARRLPCMFLIPDRIQRACGWAHCVLPVPIVPAAVAPGPVVVPVVAVQRLLLPPGRVLLLATCQNSRSRLQAHTRRVMHACMVNKDTGHWAPPEGPHEPHQSSDSSAWVSGSSGVMGTLSPFGRPCGWWPALTSAAQNTHTWQQTRCTHCMHIGHARITPTRAIPNAVHACAHAKHIAGGAPGDFAAVATMAFTGAATNMHLYV